jgi:hypothetical protein
MVTILVYKLNQAITMRKVKAILFLLLVSASIIACTKYPSNQNTEWQQNGQITLSRSMPAVTNTDAKNENMLGFVPVIASRTSNWLEISLKDKSLKLMNGTKELASSQLDLNETFSGIEPGNYQVLHMQKNPLWYAPDSYFTSRGLNLPPQGDKNRYRRGALGEYAIYIKKDTPIYSGPVLLDDIGGIRVEEKKLSSVYYQLQVGSLVEVK